MSLHPSEISYIASLNNRRRSFAFVIPLTLWVSPVVTLDQLRTAWTAVLRNHPALLKSYHKHESGWKSLTMVDVDSVVQNYVVEVPTTLASKEYIKDQFWKLVNQFDGCLWRMALLSGSNSNDGVQMLTCLLHHILTDSISNSIIIKQLGDAISQVVSGKSKIVLVPEHTSYENYVSALMQYGKSNLMTRDISYWSSITQEDLYYFPSTTGNPKSNDGQQRKDFYYTEQQLQIVTDTLKKKYNSTLYNGVLLSMLHTLKEMTGKNQGLISTVIHGRNIPEKIVGKGGEPLNVWNTIGSVAFNSWEKYGIQGNTLQEQLDNLNLMTKEIKRSGIDFSCLVYTDQGRQAMKKMLTMSNITFNFVLSTKAEKTNTKANVTGSYGSPGAELPHDNFDPSDVAPNSNISIFWWNDVRMLRGIYYNQFHSTEFVIQILKKIENRLFTWFGGDGAKL